jgi:hypothetical protein
LQDDGLIETPFECTRICPSDKWEQTIKKALEDCDIMICLVSSNFLNSNYCRRVEVKTAIESNKKLTSVVVTPCDWQTADFAKFQALLQGDCISIINTGKRNVRERTETERMDRWVTAIKELRRTILSDEK